MTTHNKASTRQPAQPLPFLPDDKIAARLRAVESQLRTRNDHRHDDHSLADELAEIAHVLDPEWKS